MSILLREVTQEILDKHGLVNFHIGTDGGGVQLALKSECGEQICLLKGLQLSRKSPAGKEVGGSAKLVAKYFGKHIAEIDNLLSTRVDVVEAREKLDAAIEELPEGFEIGTLGFVVTIRCKIRDVGIQFFPDGGVCRVSSTYHGEEENIPVSTLAKLSDTVVSSAEIQAAVQAHIALTKANEVNATAHKLMHQCSI